MAHHFVRGKRIRDVASLISDDDLASSVQLIRVGLSFFFPLFTLRTRKLKQGKEFCQWNRGRCKVHRAVLLSPLSPSFFPPFSSHVRAPTVRCIYTHTPNTIGRRARARTCHASFLTPAFVEPLRRSSGKKVPRRTK